jgi:hypothetical protein
MVDGGYSCEYCSNVLHVLRVDEGVYGDIVFPKSVILLMFALGAIGELGCDVLD